MAALWYRFCAELRARWRPWAALALLVGLAGGVVIGALAGARRTETAFDRFLVSARSPDAVVFGVPVPIDMGEVRRLPEVADAAAFSYGWIFPDLERSTARTDELSPFFSSDGFYERVNRPRVVAGRRPRADDPHEAAITPIGAASTGLGVGDTLALKGETPEQAQAELRGEDPGPPAGPNVDVTIVGIEVAPLPGEVQTSGQDRGSLHLTPAFGRRYGAEIGTAELLGVTLRRGDADLASFKAGVERIGGGQPVGFNTKADVAAGVRRSLRLQALALRLFAALAAVAGLLVLGQALSRLAFLEGRDNAALGALGMSRSQRWGVAMLRSAGIAGVGAVLAGAVAVSTSALMPFGLAREVEPSPGVSVDVPIVVLGILGVMVLTVVAAAWPAWRAAGGPDRPAVGGAERPSRLALALARAGLPPSAVAGVRMATETGRGASAVPVRTVLAGTALSVTALVTTITFGAGLGHLLETPRLYGWNWDVIVGDPFYGDLSDPAIPMLEGNPSVSGFSSVAFADVEVEGVRTQGVGFDTEKGSVLPPLLAGRQPSRPDEITVGTKTLAAVKRKVGDVITVRVGDAEAPVRIVGRSVFASLGGTDPPALGEGVLFTGEGLARLVPDAPRNLFPVEFAAGVSMHDGSDSLSDLRFVDGLILAEAPKEVADFGRVDRMPIVLSGLLGLIAGATLVHALATAVRRRQRDLAILKTLGFGPRQVGASVAWQATTLVLLALIVGLPLGVAVGRWSWSLFAEGLGIVPDPRVPLVVVLLIVPVATLLANLVAALPARAASRTSPAAVLRTG